MLDMCESVHAKRHILIFSKDISDKKEIKSNNLTQNYGQNFIYSQVRLEII